MARKSTLSVSNWLAPAAILMSISTFGITPAIAFSDPSGAGGLTINGDAEIFPGTTSGHFLLLTRSLPYQQGSVFSSNMVQLDRHGRFHSFFQFQMTSPSGIGPADGFVFVLQTQGANALGPNGEDLGYLGITPSVGIEFDTYQNSPFDINGNHVAILTNGQLNDIDPQTPYGVTSCQPSIGVFGCMSNGDVWSVWIDYDGTTLEVALADKSTTRPANLISFPIVIPIILGQSAAYVGFTAATGGGYQNHVIVDWQFIPSPAGTAEQ
jgi:hypothetical protein